MASIPTLPVEQMPELMQTVQAMMEVNPDGGQLDNAGIKTCLSQIAKALHSTVISLVTIKSSVITETGTADVAFKKLEVSFAELCAKTEEMNARLPPPGMASDAKSPSTFITKLCETKSIANLKSFGEDRTGFRLWHDKFINSISQHVPGSRGLFIQRIRTD